MHLGVQVGGDDQSDYQSEQHEQQCVEGQTTQGKEEHLQRSADGACGFHALFPPVNLFPK
jgi:hypothetical protein